MPVPPNIRTLHNLMKKYCVTAQKARHSSTEEGTNGRKNDQIQQDHAGLWLLSPRQWSRPALKHSVNQMSSKG